jgi:hypothetical protein
MELIKIKKEQLLGGIERTQEPFHAEDPTNKAGIEKTQVDGAEHDLSQFAEKDDASKKQRLKKNMYPVISARTICQAFAALLRLIFLMYMMTTINHVVASLLCSASPSISSVY